jgi:RES domain-containing protein
MARARPAPKVIPWAGTAFRATSYDVPLWVRPNGRDGRWNIAGDGSTQYLALDAEAPFAEMLRHEDLRTEDAAATFRTTLWQLFVDEGSLVDYGTFELAEAAGFPPEALVEDDYERCQAEAQWLKSHGVDALLTPSAALPGSVNLTLFGPRVAIKWNTSVALASTLRAQKLTTGNVPTGLVARVRFFGTPHVGLKAFLASRAKP